MMLVMTKMKRSLLDRWAREVFGFFNDVGDAAELCHDNGNAEE